ncbi:transposase [Solidesulfovibrio magneticus]|nr:transposase [Solidesulfovibrio magneticus]
MHLVGYFEGIDSERGIEWRCADSLSLRDFLQLRPKSWSRIIPRSAGHGPVCRWRPPKRFSPGFSKCSARMAWFLEAGSAWTLRPWRPTQR